MLSIIKFHIVLHGIILYVGAYFSKQVDLDLPVDLLFLGLQFHDHTCQQSQSEPFV